MVIKHYCVYKYTTQEQGASEPGKGTDTQSHCTQRGCWEWLKGEVKHQSASPGHSLT